MLDTMVKFPKSPETLSTISKLTLSELQNIFRRISSLDTQTENELTLLRVVAYQLALLNPEPGTEIFRTALKYYHQDVRLMIHSGTLTRDQFVDGQYLKELTTSTKTLVIYPFYFTNYYELISFLSLEFLDKYRLGNNANNDAKELDIASEAYEKFFPHLILLGRFSESLANLSGSELAVVRNALRGHNGKTNLVDAIRSLVNRDLKPSISLSPEACLNFTGSAFGNVISTDHAKKYLEACPILVKDDYRPRMKKRVLKISTRLEKPETLTLDEMILDIKECDNLNKPANAKLIAKAYADGAGKPLNIKSLFDFLYQIDDLEKSRKFFEALFPDKIPLTDIVENRLEDFIEALKFCTRFTGFLHHEIPGVKEKLQKYIQEIDLSKKSMTEIFSMMRQCDLKIFNETGYHTQLLIKIESHLLSDDVKVTSILDLGLLMEMLVKFIGSDLFECRDDIDEIFDFHIKSASDFISLLDILNTSALPRGLMMRGQNGYDIRFDRACITRGLIFREKMQSILPLIQTAEDFVNILTRIQSKYLNQNIIIDLDAMKKAEQGYASVALLELSEVLESRENFVLAMESRVSVFIDSLEPLIMAMEAINSNLHPKQFLSRQIQKKFIGYLSEPLNATIFTSLDRLKAVILQENFQYFASAIVENLSSDNRISMIPDFDTFKRVKNDYGNHGAMRALLKGVLEDRPDFYDKGDGTRRQRILMGNLKHCFEFMSNYQFSEIRKFRHISLDELITSKESLKSVLLNAHWMCEDDTFPKVVSKIIVNTNDMIDLLSFNDEDSFSAKKIIFQSLPHFANLINDFDSFFAVFSRMGSGNHAVFSKKEKNKLDFIELITDRLPILITSLGQLHRTFLFADQFLIDDLSQDPSAKIDDSIRVKMRIVSALSSKLSDLIHKSSDFIFLFRLLEKFYPLETLHSLISASCLKDNIKTPLELMIICRELYMKKFSPDGFLLKAFDSRLDFFLKNAKDFRFYLCKMTAEGRTKMLKMMVNDYYSLNSIMTIRAECTGQDFVDFFEKLDAELEALPLFTRITMAVTHLPKKSPVVQPLPQSTPLQNWMSDPSRIAQTPRMIIETNRIIWDSFQYKALQSLIGGTVSADRVISIMQSNATEDDKKIQLIQMGVDIPAPDVPLASPAITGSPVTNHYSFRNQMSSPALASLLEGNAHKLNILKAFNSRISQSEQHNKTDIKRFKFDT